MENNGWFINFIKHHQGVRRFVVIFTLFLTAATTFAGWHFAVVSHFDGLGTAGVIAAFTAPAAWLTKSVFSEYMMSKVVTE